MPALTVVIPALDDAEMLARCLDALATQTRAPDEVLVVDNGSVDDTAAVARAAGARVVPEPVRGIFPATATGFDAAEGELVARLDADSLPPSDWIERVHAAFEADPELDWLSGPGDFYGASRFTHWMAETFYIGGYVWFVGMLLGHPPLFGSNLAFRAEAWRAVRDHVHRGMREIHDDLDVAIHVRPGQKVVFDRTLRVGVSARPFATISGFRRRIDWAFGTLALNRREASYRARRREYRAAVRSRRG